MSSRAILQSVNIVTPWYVAMLQCSIIIHDLIGANCLLVWGWPLTPVAKPDDVVNSCKEVRGGDFFISVLETEFLKLPFLWWYQIEERQRRRRSLNCVSFLSSFLKIVFLAFVVASLVPLSWMFDDSQRQLSYFGEDREISYIRCFKTFTNSLIEKLNIMSLCIL